MSKLNIPENYTGRVAYASHVIANGKEARRAFDNCFENVDGDQVVAALVRRAESNPRLAANLYRYVNEQTATEAADRLKGKNLAASSREAWATYRAKVDEAFRRQHA